MADDPDAWTFAEVGDWPELFEDCGGERQSPINIAQAKADTSLSAFDLTSAEACTSYQQFLNSYTFEVEYNTFCDSLKMDLFDATWTLLQFHFHAPSEHTIGGGYYDAEAHLVHINAETGDLAVIGVLLEVSGTAENNTFLQPFFTRGLTEEPIVVENGPASNPYETFLPRDRSYFTYPGSLTTPPCSEIVTWLVMKEPVRISPWQYNRYLDAVFNTIEDTRAAPLAGNARPAQDLNGREVLAFVDGLSATTTTTETDDATASDASGASSSSTGGDVAVTVDTTDGDDEAEDEMARTIGLVGMVFGLLSLLMSCLILGLVIGMRNNADTPVHASKAQGGAASFH